jgi:hypothetical protein
MGIYQIIEKALCAFYIPCFLIRKGISFRSKFFIDQTCNIVSIPVSHLLRIIHMLVELCFISYCRNQFLFKK